jgi:hypothetical protein
LKKVEEVQTSTTKGERGSPRDSKNNKSNENRQARGTESPVDTDTTQPTTDSVNATIGANYRSGSAIVATTQEADKKEEGIDRVNMTIDYQLQQESTVSS